VTAAARAFKALRAKGVGARRLGRFHLRPAVITIAPVKTRGLPTARLNPRRNARASGSSPRVATAALVVTLAATLGGCDAKKDVAVYKGKSHSTETFGTHAKSSAPGFEAAAPAKPADAISPAALLQRVKPLFGTLPPQVDSPANPITDAKVELGRMLYFDTRLSKNQKQSCNTCHDLDAFGVDIRERDGARARTSEGHGGAFGSRNSPSVYNAALHVAQFWDGRAADIEDQAGKPIMNPIEMAMADEAAVIAVLKSIPGYAEKFAAAFPEGGDAITYANMAKAIGAFERKLVTPAAFDKFLAGDVAALDQAQLKGLQLFVDVGCTQCHTGAAVGGTQFQKLGSVKPWPDLADEGRGAITKSPIDKFVFKVPSLRNIEKTGPYLHDGSIDSLPKMVDMMAEYQAARGKLTPDETTAIVAFLGALTGTPPKDLIAEPALPESGPTTPKAEG